MTTHLSRTGRHTTSLYFLMAFFAILLLSSCHKWDGDHHQPDKPHSYPADVLDKWMTIQLRLLRNATGISNHGLARHFAYSGVAALESLTPGLHGNQKWSAKWNGLTGLPSPEYGKKYYYPANVNAAMAAINRAMFPGASDADKMAIDSLEQALNESFLAKQPEHLITRSSNYGKAVAAAIFNWAEGDGYKNAGAPYTPQEGPGLWKPTPPAFAPHVTPYWGNNHTLIAGSTENTALPAPVAYSTDPNSDFYKMAKHLYDASQNLTEDQKAMALFWRDVPGATTPGHWLSIVQQVVRKTKAPLDKAALAYALTGIAVNDGLIACFKTKMQYNLVRPVTYIREVMGHSDWNPYVGTPAHSEYPSAHSVLSTAAANVMQRLFGNIGSFTDHTYDYLGFAPRTFNSFTAIAQEASQSRLYGGIHYQQTITASAIQGKKVFDNIFGGNPAH